VNNQKNGETKNLKNKFQIPFSEPDFGEEEAVAVQKVMKSGWPSQGKYTEKFQKKLENYLSSNVSIVNNGSSGLMASLIASDFKPGQKVVVPAFTYVATASIPKMLGAEIIVSDINKETLNIDINSFENIVKKHKVDFVMLVDVAGNSCDIDAFVELSKKYKFKIIQDSAQAFGSIYKNKRLGNYQHPTIFSFQITKTLSTIEGGCIATNDEKLMSKIQKIKDYGRSDVGRYVHDFIGTNFRITDIQSAIGIEQLKKIKKHITHRNKIASIYGKKIHKFSHQIKKEYCSLHSHMLYFIIAENKESRDNCLKELIKNGIDARTSWTPIHKQPYNLASKIFNCKNAESIFNNSLTLPIYNNMPIEYAEKIVNIIEQ